MTQDEVFAALERAAILGERCPMSTFDRMPHQSARTPPTVLLSSTAISALARQGKIRIDISGRNWRTVTILVGPHAGKKTAGDPNGHKIWQTIGVERTLDTAAARRGA